MDTVVALLDRGLAAYPGNGLLLHYKGYCQYLMVQLSRGGRSTRSADAMLEEAQRSLEASLRQRPDIPETYALLASVFGQRIGSNPLRGMTLGPRSNRTMDEARRLGPDNPRVWMLDGVGAIFTPGMFGGGLDKAVARLRRAIQLFERDAPPPPLPSWGRAEAHAWLGDVHRRLGRYAEARSQLDSALALEPENGWIRFSLMPQLERDAIKR
jgi:tetratricopeptide (TPR) repeat protein